MLDRGGVLLSNFESPWHDDVIEVVDGGSKKAEFSYVQGYFSITNDREDSTDVLQVIFKGVLVHDDIIHIH